MGMNDAELTHVVESLQRLVGGVISGAWQPSRDRVLLQVGTSLLVIVPRGPYARIATTGRRPKNPPKPYSFQGALRSRISGRLIGLTKHPNDRIVDLEFDEGRLHLRLTGRSGGLWIADGDTLLAAYDGPAPADLPPVPPRPVRDDAPRFRPEADQSWDQAADRYFSQAERTEKITQRRRQLERALRRELRRTRRLRRNLEGDLDRATRAPVLRRQADALAANLHTISKGAAAAVVEDLDDPDQTWTIALDPARPAAWTMEKLYRQARRLDRAGEQVLERLDVAEKRLQRLDIALHSVPDADRQGLDRIGALVPGQAHGRQEDAPRPFVTWTGPVGQVVLVGRNAKSNRILTFQRARGTDWWMHLRGAPGAHIVLRMQRAQSPPLDLLLAVAQIALVHARVAEGTAADVQYTRVRDVRSIPGAADGRVRVANEKVLRVTRDRAALDGWSRDL